MAVLDITALKAKLDSYIRNNNSREITGATLNEVLDDMVDSLVASVDNLSFKGEAVPATDPGSPSSAEFYVTTTAGTYTNFLDSGGSALVVNADEWALLVFDGSNWSKSVISTDLSNYQKKTADSDLDMNGQNVNNLSPVLDGDTRKALMAGHQALVYDPNQVTSNQIEHGVIDIYITNAEEGYDYAIEKIFRNFSGTSSGMQIRKIDRSDNSSTVILLDQSLGTRSGITKEQFFSALDKMYALSDEDRRELGAKGAKHVENNYNFEAFAQRWVNLMLKIHEEEGSWDTRKGYSSITFKEIA